ncbi:MAG TPA: hypothetical protein VNR36_05065 [Pseudolysinimonas sp.]|nr:hypothetical protein [Pseudolysinimonas sp.]
MDQNQLVRWTGQIAPEVQCAQLWANQAPSHRVQTLSSASQRRQR